MACRSHQVCDSVIASETSVPKVAIYRERVEFVGMNRANNISILLWNITFEDGGEYTCFGRNPKEKGRNHSAIFHLLVVDECEWSRPLPRFPIIIYKWGRQAKPRWFLSFQCITFSF